MPMPSKPLAPTEIAQTRQQLRQVIPAFYNPYLFFGLTNLLGFVAIYYAVQWLKNVKATEWLAIPAVFLFANFVEYNFL
jgi:hypothetical protein